MAWGRWGGRPRLVMMKVANLHHIKQQKMNLKVRSRRTTTISAMAAPGGKTYLSFQNRRRREKWTSNPAVAACLSLRSNASDCSATRLGLIVPRFIK